MDFTPGELSDVRKYAPLAKDAYNERNLRGVKGWDLVEKFSNDDVATYQRQSCKNKVCGPLETVVSVRGTDLSSKSRRVGDLKADSYIAAGLSRYSNRHREVRRMIDMIEEENEVTSITGHSLGGRIARDIARDTGKHAVVFNMGSSPVDVFHKMASEFRDKPTSSVKHFSVTGGLGGDPISKPAALFGLADWDHRQRASNISLTHHGIDRFIDV